MESLTEKQMIYLSIYFIWVFGIPSFLWPWKECEEFWVYCVGIIVFIVVINYNPLADPAWWNTMRGRFYSKTVSS